MRRGTQAMRNASLMCAGCINPAAFRKFRFRENAPRLDAHNIWVNMCGCGAKKRVHYDFVGGSMPIMHVYTTKVNVVTILRPTPMFLQASYLGL